MYLWPYHASKTHQWWSEYWRYLTNMAFKRVFSLFKFTSTPFALNLTPNTGYSRLLWTRLASSFWKFLRVDMAFTLPMISSVVLAVDSALLNTPLSDGGLNQKEILFGFVYSVLCFPHDYFLTQRKVRHTKTSWAKHKTGTTESLDVREWNRLSFVILYIVLVV